MARKRAGISRESDTPFSAEATKRGRGAVRAYKTSVYGLIPGLGALLGPLAFIMGLWSRIKHRHDKKYQGKSTANAAIILGLSLWITNWCGLWMMWQGLQAS